MTKNLKYNCILSAPIGDKKGIFTAKIIDDKIEGNLHIMKYDNYFCGKIDNTGHCSISGNLKTLPKTLSYEASGYMDENVVTLTLDIGKRKLVLTGKKAVEGGDFL